MYDNIYHNINFRWQIPNNHTIKLGFINKKSYPDVNYNIYFYK